MNPFRLSRSRASIHRRVGFVLATVVLFRLTPPLAYGAALTGAPEVRTNAAAKHNAGTCGNGLLEGDETCSSCAPDCTVAPCTVASPPSPVTFDVEWEAPAGQPVSAIKLRLGYRAGVVALPGAGASAAKRFGGRPEASVIVVNDLDYAADVLLSASGALPAGRLFSLAFDRCASAAAASNADISCTVLECGSAFGPVQGCTCRARMR